MNTYFPLLSEASRFRFFTFRIKRPVPVFLLLMLRLLVLFLLGGCAVPATTDDETDFGTSGSNPT